MTPRVSFETPRVFQVRLAPRAHGPLTAGSGAQERLRGRGRPVPPHPFPQAARRLAVGGRIFFGWLPPPKKKKREREINK